MTAPDSWRESTLGSVTTSIRNGIFARRPNDDGRGTAILRISAVKAGRVDVYEPRFVEGITGDQVEKFAVNPGDLLMTRYNGSRHLVGIAGVVPDHAGPLIHPDKLIRVVVNDAVVDSRFVNYQLQSQRVRSFLEPRIRTTAGQSGISGRDVREIPLVVPPLDEQHRIVEILEDHLSRLDAGARGLSTAEVRLGLVMDALIGAAPELNEAPLRPLGDVLAAPLGNGRSVPTADDGFPVLRLTAMRDGVIDLSERKVGAWTAEAAAPFLVAEGDVFAARGNGSLRLVGRAAQVVEPPDPVAYPDTMIRMRPDPARVRPGYLTAVWNSRVVRRQIEARARTTAGIYKVNQTDLRGISFPVPTIDQQDRFLVRVEDWRYAVDGTRRSVDNAERRAGALRRAILAAAFSGRLAGTSSDDDRIGELAEAGV
ncbi:hypothetical protein GJV82_05320 [Cellulosimicrobium sp. BIT-GX5]|uniref:Type I restriction modification DNA specificity domain-containing protein n=1 Tax=Cellulosimicrobium composti TaxID=2672572 RepID=A0A6N7ZGD4_9MICO|nr:restriction endonuclease subunit S [Cellulosimicrobium composti]MTG88369.1 hypothetical protein [Cellulosimicrobium composti]